MQRGGHMKLTTGGLLGLGGTILVGLAVNAIWRPTEKFLDRGNWEISPACEPIRTDLMKEPGALAFAVGRDGKCGFGYGKPTVDEVRLIALQKCAAEGGLECRITFVRDATHKLSTECEAILAGLDKQPRAVALAADRTGICGSAYNFPSLDEAKARALGECESRQGKDCKITYTRDGTYDVNPECRELMASLKETGQAFVVAVHKYGGCTAIPVNDPSRQQELEQKVVAGCEREIGAGCRLHIAE